MTLRLPISLLAAVALAIGTAAAVLAAGPSGDSLQLPELMALLAQRHAAEARFQETQYLSILTHPLHSEGTLIYRAPDYLEQRIDKPTRQDMIVEHGRLTAQLGRHRRTVAMADYPQLAPLLESIRATLAGDAPQLQRLFEVRLTGALDDWTLNLTPHAGTLDAAISGIELHGMGGQIQTVRFRDPNGDHALMQIEPLP